jgi:hypothetical protein
MGKLRKSIRTIMVKSKDEQSASENFYGTNPKWISNMRSFGEMAIIVLEFL